MRGILSNWEIFWKHAQICDICDQHPQSVASFHYEPMCLIGRAIAETFITYEHRPHISTFEYVLQDSAGILV